MPDAVNEIDSEADTGSTDNQDTGSQTETASPEATSSATVDSAHEAANPEADGADGSLASGAETTQPNTQPPPEVPPQQKPEDWKVRHDGQLRANQRLSQEKKQLEAAHQQMQAKLQELEQKLSGVDLNQVREWREQREKSANPIWNPQHPEHGRFSQVHSTHQYYQRMFQRAQTDEQKQWVREQYETDLSVEDRKLIQQYQDHGRQELQRLQQDPAGYLQQYLDKRVDEKIKSFQEQTVGSYRTNLETKHQLETTLQKYPELNNPEDLQRAMKMVQEGMDMSHALRDIRMEKLEQRLSGAEAKKRSVEEKERLLQGNASISRDPAVKTNIDVYAEAKKLAKERGISLRNPFDSRFMRCIEDVKRQHNIKD